VAGGAGANAVWLAQRGLQTTICDVSEVGLAVAVGHAARCGVDLMIATVDLECDPLPVGPWALVLCCNYLQRDMLPAVARALAPGGRLVWIHPTVTNLERHPKPGVPYLLQPGEAMALVEEAGLVPRFGEEAWVGEGASARFLSRVVAERITA
jgi:tellurite methyltransferase